MKRWIRFFKNVLCNGGIFLLVTFFTYKIVFSKMNFSGVGRLLQDMNMTYLILGLLVALSMVAIESYTIKRNLHLLGENKKYRQCLVYAFSGNFFSAITPAATGGQPMQLYFMCKNKVPASKGALALLMELGSYQIAIVSIAIIGYIGCFEMINRSLGVFLPFLWLGLLLNTALLLITFTAIFSGKFIYKLVAFASKIIGVFSPAKGETFKEKALNGVQQYKMSAEVLKKNKKAYFFNSLLTLLRIIALYTAPFWIYKSLGLSGISFFQMLSLQSVLYVSCAALPSPGGAGVWESSFLLFFKEVFTADVINSAMMLSRGIGFYTVFIVCGVSLAVISIYSKVKQVRNCDTPPQ